MTRDKIHRRRSIRLRGYDYSQNGAYFVTICTQNRECLFGDIVDGEMQMNNAGRMVEKWCQEITRKYTDIHVNEYIVMPNHFHAIIVNADPAPDPDPVRADLCVCPGGEHMGPGGEHGCSGGEHGRSGGAGEHIGSPLHRCVQWFKTMTTNEYIRYVKNNGWKPFDKRLWQRNYYEHIIRSDDEYARIAAYIAGNPMNWRNDGLWAN
ncbi:MAG: hypothetical protein LBF92_02405 [Synergistaceae bacterium]|jgi:REP element-mobilizing transposase RayT|nr:hypothetical protein [Synergistaceae bacterium]